VERDAEDVPPQGHPVGDPRERDEQREQLVGVQHEGDAAHSLLAVVPQERRGSKIALALDDDVVKHVIHVDEKAARDHAGDERGGAGQRVDTRACERGRDEVPTGAHAGVPGMRS
jgi:hypothetical protein